MEKGNKIEKLKFNYTTFARRILKHKYIDSLNIKDFIRLNKGLKKTHDANTNRDKIEINTRNNC